MRKRGGASAARSHANPSATRSHANPSATYLSPPPVASPSPGGRSSNPYDFDFTLRASSSARKKAAAGAKSASPLGRHPAPPASPPQRPVPTISDLKELASSRADAIKRSLDQSHCEILKEFEAAHTRLTKRLKLQTQACLQLSEEIEKEYKKVSVRVTENMELMEASFAELVAESQASASRVCKVTIPELAQSMEKAIDGLRSRYKLPLASA